MSNRKQVLGDDEKIIDNARDFLEDMRARIIEQELPTITRYLVGLEKLAASGNERIQLEALGQEQLLLEIIRITYRLLNLVHQLMNTKPLLKLLEQHEQEETNDDMEEKCIKD